MIATFEATDTHGWYQLVRLEGCTKLVLEDKTFRHGERMVLLDIERLSIIPDLTIILTFPTD